MFCKEPMRALLLSACVWKLKPTRAVSSNSTAATWNLPRWTRRPNFEIDSFANVRKQSRALRSFDSLFPMEVDVSNKKTISASGMQSCVVTVDVAVVVTVVVGLAV